MSSTEQPKHYITKYVKEDGCIKIENGSLSYSKITPVFADGEAPKGHVPINACFLYDDYSAQLKPGDVFYEITLIKVDENHRRQKIGTNLVKKFFTECNPKSVIIQAGITDEDLYNQLCETNQLQDFIYKNIVPFYESLGFTDVNHTTFYFEESVPMLWPKNAANEAKRLADEFEKKR